jgi:hypothetical protein
MRKKTLLYVVVTVALVCFFAFRLFSTFASMEIRTDRALTPEGPIPVLERDLWDFGVVPSGPTLVTLFPIKNVGGRRLIVRRRTSSCECVAGDQDTIILQPGESTEITATLDTRELEGAFQLELPYTTSAPNLPKFTLYVRATVTRPELADAN